MNASLHNKNIILGVCGGIAAYKSADLVRRLQDAGAQVRVIMTSAAMEFITPLTFQALSGYPVHTDLLDTEAEAAMGHIELARWADLVLIAPATANSLARLASGRADDLLCAVCLASKAKIAVAPAMNHVMWSADTTQNNLHSLSESGVEIFGPDAGLQACGEVGEGRLLDTEQLVHACSNLFSRGLLQGLKIMITAGPTFEPIDPVRYIGNRSSGRMGFAIAEAAIEQGAIVSLIAGPVHLTTPQHCQRTDVETALQMHQAVMSQIAEQDVFIATAAVADYRPHQVQLQKIKKTTDKLNISLSPNPDILKEVAALSKPPFTLGFAAETENVKDHALLKLKNKKLNMIAANRVAHMVTTHEESQTKQDSGFNSEYNALQVLWKDGELILEHARKTQLARQLLTILANRYYEKTST
ncbi:MAG: bifunctional phosphopantothenoylcysteine decarboxylase/phosphopantothenate--cysteine ligase CoaBC [Gammaproteobacteria bacterium]|nr:bifunctional phosphopantothenoylcysteine decarboxylase/phosphopantothenate--cysteine ligase CoaBC [Gammaproteobacteria bacterium]